MMMCSVRGDATQLLKSGWLSWGSVDLGMHGESGRASWKAVQSRLSDADGCFKVALVGLLLCPFQGQK